MEIKLGSGTVVLLKRFHPHTFLVVVIIMPMLGALGIALALWWGMNTSLFVYTTASFAGMYLFSGFGITIGNHRLWTHESFKARLPVRVALAIMSSTAWQQDLLHWVPPHKIHHAFTDREGDPHSPVLGRGTSLRSWLYRFYWAHIGWIISPYTYPEEYVERFRRPLKEQSLVRFQAATHHFWAFGGLLLPAVLALPFWGWQGSLLVLLIAGVLRVVCVWHATWFINSGTHLWGDRPNKIANWAANLALWIFGLGEAFHNNHHADERSAWHGWKWYDPDPSKWIIWTLERLRLVYDVRRPKVLKVLA